MIGIINYRMGNLRSVQKAFETLGVQAVILSSPQQAGEVDRLVLPGVGAFADGMKYLNEMGFSDAIRDFISTGRPFLGICLGMQLLFEGSQEDAISAGELVDGLAVFRGHVLRFQGDQYGPGMLKVPHMGWNTLRWQRDDPLLAGLDQDCAVYFVHSYYPQPVECQGEDCTSAIARHGLDFCASLWRGNVWATQFHPEKSQRVGLKMLSNFLEV